MELVSTRPCFFYMFLPTQLSDIYLVSFYFGCNDYLTFFMFSFFFYDSTSRLRFYEIQVPTTQLGFPTGKGCNNGIHLCMMLY